MNKTLEEFIREYKKAQIEESRERDTAHLKQIEEKQYLYMEKIFDRLDAFRGRYSTKEGLTNQTVRKQISDYEYERYINKLKKYKDEHDYTDLAKIEMNRNVVNSNVTRMDVLSAEINTELITMTSEEEQLTQQHMVNEAREEYIAEVMFISAVALFMNRDKRKVERYRETTLKKIPSDDFILRNIVNRDYLSSRWSDRIWNNQDALRSELDRLIRDGITQGRNPRVIARDIRETFESSVFNSERLVITEMSRAQADAQEDSYKRSGYKQYMFIAESTACDDCSELDGEIFDVKDMEKGKNCNPLHPFCKCSTAAYMEREAFEADLAERGL